ncbi:hypothetical protein [Pseudothermotoga sp.]|uniref:hypothetical protein n=1 Tax=Pseudothermotoga sp. TaxID=2033661 RepID=UPI0031F6BCC6
MKISKTEIYLKRLRPQTIGDAAYIISGLPLRRFVSASCMIRDLLRSELNRGTPIEEITKVLKKFETFLEKHNREKKEIWDNIMSQIFNK